MPRAEALEKGIAAGERSLALDPKNADAVYSLVALATFTPLVWVAWHDRHEGAVLFDPS